MKKFVLGLAAALLAVGLTSAAMSRLPREEAEPRSIPDQNEQDMDENENRTIDCVAILDKAGWIYPVSMMENGTELIPAQASAMYDEEYYELDTVLENQSLTKIDVPDPIKPFLTGISGISTNIEIEVFSDDVSYQSYSIEAQPENDLWHQYFAKRLEEDHYNAPLIIQTSMSYPLEGDTISVVVASNIDYEKTVFTDGDAKEQSQVLDETQAIYCYAAVFNETSVLKEIFFLQYSTDCDETIFLFGENREFFDGYEKMFRTAQFSADHQIITPTMYCGFNDELGLRKFHCRPEFMICDIDHDENIELVCIFRFYSSLMSRIEIYELTNEAVEEEQMITDISPEYG